VSAELLRRAEAAFDAGAWRDALLAFEAAWHTERDEGTRALVLLCNALLQLERGMSTAPRRALQIADRLLHAGAPTVAGYDMMCLRHSSRTRDRRRHAGLGDHPALHAGGMSPPR
jgi:hypothetical protein